MLASCLWSSTWIMSDSILWSWCSVLTARITNHGVQWPVHLPDMNHSFICIHMHRSKNPWLNDVWMNVFFTPIVPPLPTNFILHTHPNHKHTPTPGELSPHVRTLCNFSYRSTQRTSPLKSPVHRHTVLFVLIILAHHSWQVWRPFTHRLRGWRKCWHGHLSHEFQLWRRESADAANCVRRKSWQRSEIKCQQLLMRPVLIFHARFPVFHIYLSSDLLTRKIKRIKGVENMACPLRPNHCFVNLRFKHLYL